jgi:hypothetical protein
MTTTPRCRAKGGPSKCTKANCPARVAFVAELSGFQRPTKSDARKAANRAQGYSDVLQNLARMRTPEHWSEDDATHIAPVSLLGFEVASISSDERKKVLDRIRSRRGSYGDSAFLLRRVPLGEVTHLAQSDFRPDVLDWYVKEKQNAPKEIPDSWELANGQEEAGAWGLPGPLLVRFWDRSVVFDGTHRFLAAHLTQHLEKGEPTYHTYVVDLTIPASI